MTSRTLFSGKDRRRQQRPLLSSLRNNVNRPSTVEPCLVVCFVVGTVVVVIVNVLVHDHVSRSHRHTMEHAIDNFVESGGARQAGARTSGAQVVKTDKFGHPINHAMTALHADELLRDIGASNETLSISREAASRGREPLLALMIDAGVTEIDTAVVATLPLWEDITKLYGSEPVILYGDRPEDVNADPMTHPTCVNFRTNIPLADATIGVAGLFNTGTNPLNMLVCLCNDT
jgi:hypothetical protein